MHLKGEKCMIMIWNRKEVFIGSDLNNFNEVLSKLSANGIDYEYRIVDDTSPSFFGASRRARTGTFGENIDYSKTYYIYVQKKDYDHATNLLRK